MPASRHRKSVIVTGGSRGIGRATALAAAHAGYEVCVNFRTRQADADALVREISTQGGKAIAVQADVADPPDVRRLFEAADRNLAPLYALVNNAGIVAEQRSFADIDLARFKRILETNVLGAFLCSQAALRVLSRSRGGDGGVIVNVSSVAARTGSPHEYVDYAASKGAVDTIFLSILGRRPTVTELGLARREIETSAQNPAAGCGNLIWALLNTREFMFIQ